MSNPTKNSIIKCILLTITVSPHCVLRFILFVQLLRYDLKMQFLFFIVLFIFIAKFDVIASSDQYFSRNLASFVGNFDAEVVNDKVKFF